MTPPSGATIAAARREAGLSLRELAGRAGTSHSAIAAYEQGRKDPTTDTYRRLLRSAGFAADTMLHKRIGRGDDERRARGRELIDVLELADMFPANVPRAMTCPPFGYQR
ncbi:MAG: helix-turn-helix transcriptional regulator [Ilumatobacteraceae bacterium]|nr:helix-turn-helix transcriptional regulator [Ilumatobacteraceae bacterium]